MSDKLVVGKTEDGLIFVAAPEERYEVITSCLTN